LSALATVVNFKSSAFVPLALGFFGLGTGYLIYGPQELARYPARERKVDVTTGIWGVWMPGFLQFVTGIILFVGLTWFSSFTQKPLYMAALAFTAYGVHWFALGLGRTLSGDPRPNAFMAIPFMVLSAIGATVFFGASDNPVGGLFVGLFVVYVCELFASLGLPSTSLRTRSANSEIWEQALGFVHIVVGVWLMYLTTAAALNLARGFNLPL
jgi:hypothetical protein